MTVAFSISVAPNQDKGLTVRLFNEDSGDEVNSVIIAPGGTYETHVWDERFVQLSESEPMHYARRAKYEDMTHYHPYNSPAAAAYSPIAQ